MGIPIFELPGFEADDLLGALADQAVAQGVEVIIATGDADTLQLVAPSVRVLMARQGLADVVLYDEAAVLRRYGITPGSIPDFKALRGDASDNLPGLPGVGDKTAAKLLQEFRSIGGSAKHRASHPAKLRELLRGNEETVRRTRELATIVRDARFAPPRVGSRWAHGRGASNGPLQALEFSSLVQRLEEVIPAAAGQPLKGIIDWSATPPTSMRSFNRCLALRSSLLTPKPPARTRSRESSLASRFPLLRAAQRMCPSVTQTSPSYLLTLLSID
jgi:DNA polymerase-1